MTGELAGKVKTTVADTLLPELWVQAEAQDRISAACRDLECFGRPVRLVRNKRRWRRRDADCRAKEVERGRRGDGVSGVVDGAAVEATVMVGRDVRPAAE